MRDAGITNILDGLTPLFRYKAFCRFVCLSLKLFIYFAFHNFDFERSQSKREERYQNDIQTEKLGKKNNNAIAKK